MDQLEEASVAINQKKEVALKGLESQADRMLKKSNRENPCPMVGSNVKLKIPEVDRTRVDLPNVLALVLEIHSDLPMYKLGTRFGVLEGWLNRKDFVIVSEIFLYKEEVPTRIVELRKAASEASLFGG